MAGTFDELVAMQRAADRARSEVEELRDRYGPPTGTLWTELQTHTYETAWHTWRDLARAVQRAITEYARDQGAARSQVEADVKGVARHPGVEG
ncbi:hypothetical protein [Streptomyces sp. UG1]|uniref:hypothetical protein n=1 Tax=Streptomyces sp. UG1 TaxID=3417652 RepID=UPI003CE9A155